MRPGNFLQFEEAHLKAFRPGRKARFGQACAEDDLNLAEAGDGIDRQHAIKRDTGPGFLPGFALGALGHRLVHFQVAGGQGPVAPSRLDRPAAEQDAPIGDDDAADHHLGVLIGDVTALGTGQPFAVVTLRHLADELGHTLTMIPA